ncbi:C39 family peptidase [Gordonia sp. NPDC003376]
MTIKTLPVNPAIVTQETYYNCGPATVQNLIWAKSKVIVAEGVLARDLGTTVNGTDYIGYLDRVLGNRLGIDHLTVNIPNDPPTATQVNEFWSRLKTAVDNGFGVAMNWIAPPSNYPRGVKGSTSPSYGGGTVYHYVAAVGYDDAAQAVFVADSGFQPKTYWITLSQCVSLVAGKGYAYPYIPVSAASNPDPMADVRAQLTGSTITGVYTGWAQLGGRTVTDALGAILGRLA